MRDLLLVGGGGHCRAVIDVIEREGRWRIAGIVDPGLATGAAVLGHPVLGGDDDLAALKRHVGCALVTLGQIRTAEPRIRVFDRLRGHGFELATVVSPLAAVSRHASLGEGTVVLHFAAVGPGATVGSNTILNTRSLVEHDARVGAHCHISTGAVLNGGTEVGDNSFVGSGAVLRERIRIGPNAFVAMGSRVAQSAPGAAGPAGEREP